MRKKMFLIDDFNSETGKYLSSSCDFDIIISKDNYIPDDINCILVSDSYASNNLNEIVTELKCNGLPVIIVSFNTSVEAQEQFALTKADDVIFLPMYGKLIEKRIGLICGDDESTDFSFIDEISKNVGQGAYIVDQSDFQKLFEFVRRLLERLEKEANLVVFSLSNRFDSILETEYINSFSSVEQRCLRKGDICCKTGNNLYVLLMGADRRNSELVAKRLIESFSSLYEDDTYDISFVVKPIN